MAYENYTIRQFMDALFKGDRTVMNDEELTTVNTEYIDTAGLYETEEFNQVTYIHYLSGRINSINLGIKLQREFLSNFGKPYLPELKFFKKFGHTVYWSDNEEEFLGVLKRIELKEKKYISELENKMKQLIDKRAKKNTGEEVPIKQTRDSFIRTLNSLGKIGYKIDKDKDTVEDLAYMIKQQLEESNKAT